ncbi:MAG: helix-turn-helix transcriptional regulator [Acidimicrobiia bacterium]|nr:helix-turn-helix transcriptional regulator [Acidimicrobiia bacterium]
MAKPVKPRRAYHSAVRRQQAAQTRDAVLAAARALFESSGYVSTTIEAIAERAAVSPETVYAVFGSKRSLLEALIDVTIAGDSADVPILDREWVGQLRAEDDPGRQLRLLARNGRRILERITPLYLVLQGAAAADTAAAQALSRYAQQRFIGQRALLGILLERQRLRRGLSKAKSAEILFGIGSPEMYGLLVLGRGWSPAQFETWYADALERLLFTQPRDA